MALFDNAYKLGGGLAVGLGVVILAPIVAPVVAEVVKPLVKAAIKGSIVMVHKGRQMVAEAVETLEDLAAEAQAELEQEREAALIPAEAAAEPSQSA